MRPMSIFLASKKTAGVVVCLSCLLAVVTPVFADGAGPYEIIWHTIDGGGGQSSGGPYVLTDTIG